MRASRLALLAGFSAVVLTLIGCVAVSSHPAVGAVTGVVAASVLAIGLYLGPAAVSGAALVAVVGGLSLGGIADFRHAVLGACMFTAALATARICMDARRPAVVSIDTRRQLAVAPAATVAIAAVAAVLGSSVAHQRPSPWLVPIAVAAVSSVLFVRPSEQGSKPRQTIAIVGSVVVACLIVLGATSQAAPATSESSEPSPAPIEEPTELVVRDAVEPEQTATDLPEYIAATLIVTLGILLIGLLRKSLRAIQPMEFKPSPITSGDGELAVLDHRRQVDQLQRIGPEDAAAVISATLRALETIADPRRAVRLAYATLEDGFGDLAVARRSTETETDYLRRLEPLLPSASGALARLTRTFENARFSDHSVAEDDRRSALAAFHEVRNDLASREPGIGLDASESMQ